MAFSVLIAGWMGLTAWFVWSRGVWDIVVYLAWGVVSGGVVGLDLAAGGINDRGFNRSNRCGGFFLAAAMAALDLVYLLLAE